MTKLLSLLSECKYLSVVQTCDLSEMYLPRVHVDRNRDTGYSYFCSNSLYLQILYNKSEGLMRECIDIC